MQLLPPRRENCRIEIGGPAATQFDQLNVVGSVGVVGAGIKGTLNVRLAGGYVPSVGDTFAIMSNDVAAYPDDSFDFATIRRIVP